MFPLTNYLNKKYYSIIHMYPQIHFFFLMKTLLSQDSYYFEKQKQNKYEKAKMLKSFFFPPTVGE